MKKHRLNHEKKPKGILSSLVLRLGVFAAVIVCIPMIISNPARELESDEYSYMENYALNYLNYAYPNERRFYDTSRN